jgi:uncharacterized membrane protein
VTAAFRLLLLPAYVVLAHLAEARESPTLALIALVDLALLVLIEGLVARRAAAWLGAAVALAGLARGGFALTALLLVPPAFTALIGTWFLRSLRSGRVPLIRKVVAAIYATTPDALAPDYLRYTRRVTLGWGLMLWLLTAINLVLALVAVPNGLLAHAGITAPFTVTEGQWSFIANVANYGLLGGFALVEYQIRRRRFPVRPYKTFAEFVRRLAALGPAFWRDFFRSDDVGAVH